MFLLVETGDAAIRVAPVGREDEVRPVDPDFSLPLNQPIFFTFYLGNCGEVHKMNWRYSAPVEECT